MHAVVRFGLLLHMSHAEWSVCLSVLGPRVSCAKIDKQIEMPFRGLTHVGPRNHVLDGVKIGESLYSREVTSATRPFAKLL